MAYNRDGAVAYATKHWNVVCHDGIICCKKDPHDPHRSTWRNVPPALRSQAQFVLDPDKGTEHAEYREWERQARQGGI
jgi:hypothetical protein